MNIQSLLFVRRVLIVALLLTAVAFAWHWSSPNAQVMRKTKRLAKVVQKQEAGETPVSLAFATRHVGEQLQDNAILTLNGHDAGTANRQDILTTFTQFRSYIHVLTIQNLRYAVAESSKSTVVMNVSGFVSVQYENTAFEEPVTAMLTWTKGDKRKWKLQTIDLRLTRI